MAKDPANPLCLPVPQTQYQQSPEQQSPQAEEQVDQKRWYKRLAGYAVTEAAAGYAVTRPEAPAQDRFVLTQSPYAELELLGMWVGAVMWIPKEENRAELWILEEEAAFQNLTSIGQIFNLRNTSHF
ncbi:hypothetical protein ACET3Z_024219 [Daucus carota]